jgi:hypothetical protein
MKVLELSSMLFFTNFLHNTFYREWIYAWIFLLLTTTSLFVHSEIFKNDGEFGNQMVYLDKSVIASIFFYGLYLYWKSLSSKQFNDMYLRHYFPLISISIVIWFYIGGYYLDKYCFDSDRQLGNLYHATIHIVGSLGHHSIMNEYSNYA